MVGLRTPSEVEQIKRAEVEQLWKDVEKKVNRNEKVKEIYSTAMRGYMTEYMAGTPKNEMGTDSSRLIDIISRFIEKYAPIGDVIKSVDNRHHRGQLGFGIFTLLWLVSYYQAIKGLWHHY